MTRYDISTHNAGFSQAPNRRRLLISVAGIVGFLLLLLTAHFAGGFEKPLQAAALIWFLVFGILRFGLDLTGL